MGHASNDCPRCADLQEELAYLRSELGDRVRADEVEELKRAFGLTPQTARLLLVLHQARGRTMTRHQIEDAVPAKCEDDERTYGFVSVIVCQLRRRVGFRNIENIFAAGYRLSPEMNARVAAIVEPLRQGRQAAA